MIPLIYTILLLLMLYILYRAGVGLSKNNCRILSAAGIAAILVYTLNEGLRFGRGIDYSYYWEGYDLLVAGHESKTNIGFLFIEKLLIGCSIPFQGCVMVMSFMFILGSLFLMKCYKDVIFYALPFFICLSIKAVENMVRWYLGYSFILIGLSFQLLEKEQLNRKFILFSLIGCTIHYAILPIPIILYLISKIKKAILSPIVTIIAFYAIAFLFKTDVMLNFVILFNTLAMMSEKFESYSNNAEFWLTAGQDGVETTPFPSVSEQLFLCAIIWAGYKSVQVMKGHYIFAYNLFIIGFLLYPIARQIELLERYDQIFFFFRAIVLASVLYVVFQKKQIKLAPAINLFLFLIFANYGRVFISGPFSQHPQRYLYVWDKGKQTPASVLKLWNDTREENSKGAEKMNKKIEDIKQIWE